MFSVGKSNCHPSPQCQLDELTDKEDNTAAKMLSYNRANRAVAVLCNHQVGNTIFTEHFIFTDPV